MGWRIAILTRTGEYAVSIPWPTFKRKEQPLLWVTDGGAGLGCVRLRVLFIPKERAIHLAINTWIQ